MTKLMRSIVEWIWWGPKPLRHSRYVALCELLAKPEDSR